MDRVLEKMIKCQPGQEIILNEANDAAEYVYSIKQESGCSVYPLTKFKLQFMGLHMQVLTWMGETRTYSPDESEVYIPEFFAIIGEQASMILSSKYGRAQTINIFWKSGDEALLTWGSAAFTTKMGLIYGSGGMNAVYSALKE